MKNLSTDTFKQEIFDYENADWKFKGQKPCVIDFFADWCGPCKTLGPILEELEKEFKDDVDFFKVDIEEEEKLAQIFEIRSIPTLLFLPIEGSPQKTQGLIPKQNLIEAIKNIFNL